MQSKQRQAETDREVKKESKWDLDGGQANKCRGNAEVSWDGEEEAMKQLV